MTDPDVRDRVLQAAVEAAAIHGISRLTVGDVAKRAGVSRPTLYKHFRSKEELVAAAVEREADRMVSAVAPAELPDDPRAALEAGILAVLQVTRDHPLLDRLIRTEPASSGCRSESSDTAPNSPISSRNSTPRWARLTSPGRSAWEPPPTRATCEIV